MDKIIDFVLLWVDGNDSNWLKEKNKYDINIKKDSVNSNNRYRDWNNLQYWFRAVEKYAPWVRKIHFITWGHIPNWLNINNPKLNILNHKDYIPQEYLPTFNSNVIELNLYRIKDLSENFVLFNDDMFINKPVKPQFFFKNELPCDSAILSSIDMKKIFSYTIANNLFIINKYFQKNKCIYKNPSKWFNLKYGKYLCRTISLTLWKDFTGFHNFHVPISHKKSTFQEVWDKEYELLNTACKNKFRSKSDISHWVFRDWNLVKGNFYPRACYHNKSYPLHNEDDTELTTIVKDIIHHKHTLICMNDDVTDENYFNVASNMLLDAFETALPNKSSFEI